MKRKYKIILGSLLAVIILGLSLLQYTEGIDATLLEVQPQTIIQSFKEEGKIVPKVEQPVFAPYTHEIIELSVVEGQRVEKGDLLIKLDPKDLEFQLRQLQTQVLSAWEENFSAIRTSQLLIAQLELEANSAQRKFQQYKELYNAGAISKQDFEHAEKNLEITVLNLEQQRETLRLLQQSPSSLSGSIGALETQIEHLEYQISRGIITAPIDGIISNVNIKKGGLAPVTQPLMTIFQDQSYLVEVFVLDEDVHSLVKNMEVTVSQDRKDGDILLTGTVQEIAPSIVERLSPLGLEEQRVKVTIGFNVPEGLRLLPGSKVDVEFTTSKRENELVVPKTVLFPYQGGHGLWVVRNGKAQIQPVLKGFENERHAVIEQGLEKGDLVIINPQLEGLGEGKRISSKGL